MPAAGLGYSPPTVLSLILTDVATGGAAVGRAPDGRVVFARHGIPGEHVLVRVTEETKSWLRGDVVEVLQASPDRIEAACPYAGPGRCGGCDYQHVALDAQRRMKGRLLAAQLRRIGHHVLDEEPEVEALALPDSALALPDSREATGVTDAGAGAGGLGWRTRVRLGVDGTGRLGLRRHRSHELQLVDQCLLAHSGIATVDLGRTRFPGAKQVELLSVPAHGAGLGSDLGVEDAPAPHWDQQAETGAGGLPVGQPPIVVVDGVRKSGPRQIVHVVAGRRFVVSPGTFWQVHPAGAAVLGQVVVDELDPRPREFAVDLYAGAGLFAGLLGDVVGAGGRVLAVEASSRAATDARANLADQVQTKVLTAPVTPTLVRHSIGTPDLVVLDPPRAGAGPAVTGALARLRPRRLAYVACDTATFSRDLRFLLDAQWSLVSLRAFDLFPMTEHVEIVAIFEPPKSPT